jgi:hypothetical protein
VSERELTLAEGVVEGDVVVGANIAQSALAGNYTRRRRKTVGRVALHAPVQKSNVGRKRKEREKKQGRETRE